MLFKRLFWKPESEEHATKHSDDPRNIKVKNCDIFLWFVDAHSRCRAVKGIYDSTRTASVTQQYSDFHEESRKYNVYLQTL